MSTQLYKNSQEEILEESKIYGTRNYSMFTRDEANRPVCPEKVTKLMASIQEKNLLHLWPIVVDLNLRVMDGQHRLAAAELLGVPIYYVVSGQITILDVPRVTGVITKWTPQNYMHYYCKHRVRDYLMLAEYLRKYPFIKLGRAIQLFLQGDKKGHTELFRNGQFRADRMEYAELVAESVLDFKPWFAYWHHDLFVQVIGNLVDNVNYDHARMMRKMEWLSKKLVKCPDLSTYIANLSEIYNFKERNQVELKALTANETGRKGWGKAKV